jgi:hypothetical protein
MRKHPGIKVDRIPVTGGPGLIFAIGLVAIFLIEIPITRLVLALGLVGGLIFAVILRWTDRTR